MYLNTSQRSASRRLCSKETYSGGGLAAEFGRSNFECFKFH